MNNMTDTPTVSPVTFHVFRRDGSRNPDIKHSFLEIMYVGAHDAMEGFLRLSDNTMWQLVLEPEVASKLTTTDSIHCIVSFQARVNGNFAVARLYREGYKPKGRHS